MKKTLLVILCSVLWSIRADAQTAFYQGKTIRIIVGTPPGKYIPGNPTFIVQNMPAPDMSSRSIISTPWPSRTA